MIVERFEPKTFVKTIYELFTLNTLPDFKNVKFSIPAYQRPYKWNQKNVAQLIDDINTVKQQYLSDKNTYKNIRYRIGTIVYCYNADNKKELEIVDGQQRSITISLILYYFKNKEIQRSKIEKLLKIFPQSYDMEITKINIQKNYALITKKIEELFNPNIEKEEFLLFLLEHCEVVVVILNNIAEAFQFFDSQNSRGKPLEPYDLLKAYHLRAIKEIYKNAPVVADEIQTTTIKEWEDKAATDELKELFFVIFHIRSWSKRKRNYNFTKDEIYLFKGITEGNYPAYKAIQCLQSFNKENDYEISKDVSYQIDNQILNGEFFFNSIYYYSKLLKQFQYKIRLLANNYENDMNNVICKIAYIVNSYQNRTGDKYLRQLFDATLLYYINRFTADIDKDPYFEKVLELVFKWVYVFRVKKYKIKCETILNHSVNSDSEDGYVDLINRIKEIDTPKELVKINPFKTDFKREIGKKVNRDSSKDFIQIFKELKVLPEEAQ